MKTRFLLPAIILTAGLFFASCSSCDDSGIGPDQLKGDPFKLTSTDIQSGGSIAQTFAYTACSGDNNSPQLTWVNPPAGAKSYAITLIDKNAMGWIHWILYDLPSSTTSLDRNAALPTGATASVNSFGTNGYGGPCPPAGSTHTYQFKVWALDIKNLSEIQKPVPRGNNDFIEFLGNHVLNTTSLDATYTNTQ